MKTTIDVKTQTAYNLIAETKDIPAGYTITSFKIDDSRNRAVAQFSSEDFSKTKDIILSKTELRIVKLYNIYTKMDAEIKYREEMLAKYSDKELQNEFIQSSEKTLNSYYHALSLVSQL